MFKDVIITFLFFLISYTYCGIYSEKNSFVIQLNKSNFNRLVVESSDIWLIEFYGKCFFYLAPWCGLCKTIVPEFESISKYLRGVIKVGVVNMEEERSVGSPYNIKAYPTIMFFGADKSKPIDFKGDLAAKNLAQWTFNQAKKIVMDRIEGNSEEPNADFNDERQIEEEEGIVIKKIEDLKKEEDNSSESKNKSESKEETVTDEPDVVILTDSNFDSVLRKSDSLWLIEFYAPWCGHCKKLEPQWNMAAKELRGKVKLGKVDCTVHKKIASLFSINGYPTIYVFPPGVYSKDGVEEYEVSL